MLRLFNGEFKGKLLRDATLDTKWIVFGAGSLGRLFIAKFKDVGAGIRYISDNAEQKWGTRIDGVEVVPPAKLQELGQDHKIITATIYEDEVRRQLAELGLAEQICSYHDAEFMLLILQRQQKSREKALKIEQLKDLLADEKSRRVLQNVILYRATGDLEVLFRDAEPNEYFPSDIIHLTDAETFVDAGAYTGDTIREFLTHVNNSYEEIIAFEPDTNTFRKLRAAIYEIQHESDSRHNIRIHETGLSRTNKKVSFTNNGFMHSQIDPEGRWTIEVNGLDEMFGPDKKITFIKMDIEGEEINAILGAQELIKKQKPKLAICVYHNFDDLWEIPLLLKKLVPEYKIYLRHHGLYEPAEMYDTICYAVAEGN